MGDPRQMWENMQRSLQRAQQQGKRYAGGKQLELDGAGY